MDSANPLQQLLVRGLGTTNVVADRLKLVIQSWVSSGRIDASQAATLIDELRGRIDRLEQQLRQQRSDGELR